MNEELSVIAGAGGGSGCFRKGTRIQLEHGKTIAIEELEEGDEILAFDEKGEIHIAKVTKVHYHLDPQPILRVKFWRGETYITPNHWVLNQYGNFAEMGALTTHDALVDGMGHLRPIIGAELVGHEPVWNLTVEPHHTFIADNIRVHNGGHRDRYPVIAGAGGGGSKKGGGRAATEDKDSLQSRAMVSLLDLLGEGQIGGLVGGPTNGAQSIFLNDTTLQNPDGTYNFNGFIWDARNGAPDQLPITGFSDIETPFQTGVKVRRDTSHGDPGDAAASYTVTVTNPNVDQVRVIVSTPTLMSQDTKTGDIHGTTVQYKFSVATDGGPFVDLGGIQTMSGKTRSRYQRAHLLTLPKPGSMWNIRMTRITPDPTTSSVSNDIYFDSYIEVVNSRLNYPNSALVGISIDSAQFNQIPTRSYLVDGLYIRVPSNYDPVARLYTGVWDGTFKVAVSNNPAWVLFDVLTSRRYGLGQFLADGQIDKAKLYQIGRYCDELVDDGFGQMEPRFTCNTVIANLAEAFKLISDLTSIFRGMGYWDGSLVGFTQDAPTDISMVFNPSNVIDGLFTYTGAARKDRHSVALVTWNDPTQNYKQVVEYVEDADLVAKWGVRKIDMVAVGCTSRGQANRVGRWILYTEKYESEFVTFKVGTDAALVLPGEVIKIHDTSRAGKRMGGRLQSATPNSATLDAPVTFGAGATISIRLPDGTFADRTVLEASGTYQTLTWATALPAQPVANAIWMLAETALQPMLARVVSVAQDSTNAGQFTIMALEHNPTKYDAIEKGLVLELPKTSLIDPNANSAPINLGVAETTYLVAPGVLGTKLHVSWSGANNSYELKWRCTGKYQTNWATISSSSTSIDLDNVRQGTYEFSLVGINLFGARTSPVTYSYTVQGKTTAPGDVSGFMVTERVTDLLLTWNAVTDIDLAGYEVRVGASWDAGTVITTGFSGTMLTHDQNAAGTYFYHIRSIDTSGNYSDNVSTASIVLNAPQPVSQFDCIQSGTRLEFRWLANPEPDIAGYEIREGSSWQTSQFVAQTSSTTYTLPAGSSGVRTFWIKAIAMPGVYGDTAAFVNTAVALPTNRNMIWSDDEFAAGFPGVKHFASVSAGDLAMDANVPRSEYIFDVNLGAYYRAQNTVFATIDAVTNDTVTWGSAGFSWSSNLANREWVRSGSLNSVSARYQIAPYAGLLTGEVDGWRMDGALASVTGVNPTQSAGVTYGTGRYGQGVLIQDTTTVSWAASIPAQFNTTFWIIPQEVIDATFWSVTGAGGISLTVGYSAQHQLFYLEDNLGQRVEVPFVFAVHDRLCIGVVQTATVRRLYVGRMGDAAIQGVTRTLAPLGAFTAVRLY